MYTQSQIAHANRVIQQFERLAESENLSKVFEKYEKATKAPPAKDPLILDLNGDGISITSLSSSTAYSDLDANGYA